MKIIDFLVQLRRELLEVMGLVVNAHSGWRWGKEQTNLETKLKLKEILDKSINSAERYEVYLVTRHLSCPNPIHSDEVISKGRHGVKKYKDENFVWTGVQFDYGKRVLKCPCIRKSKPIMHSVVDELVVRRTRFSRRHQSFIQALEWVDEAINLATDNRPRSSIREALLLSILELNDGILPQTVDQYIESRSSLAAQRSTD